MHEVSNIWGWELIREGDCTVNYGFRPSTPPPEICYASTNNTWRRHDVFWWSVCQSIHHVSGHSWKNFEG